MTSPTTTRPPPFPLLLVSLLVLSAFPHASLSQVQSAAANTNLRHPVADIAGSAAPVVGNVVVTSSTGTGSGSTGTGSGSTGIASPTPVGNVVRTPSTGTGSTGTGTASSTPVAANPQTPQGGSSLPAAGQATPVAPRPRFKKGAPGDHLPMPTELMTGPSAAWYQSHIVRQFLDGHNQVRGYLGMPLLSWNRTLAKFARRVGDSVKDSCSMTHSPDPRDYGENMFWGEGNLWRPVDAVQDWAGEYKHYVVSNNSCEKDMKCGHYTQMIWKTSTQLGCARVQCTKGGVVVVCNYWPPGNYEGEGPFNPLV